MSNKTKDCEGALDLGIDHACLTGDCDCERATQCLANTGEYVAAIVDDASDQIVTLQAENERLKAELDRAWRCDAPLPSQVSDGEMCKIRTNVLALRMYGAEARMKWKSHWIWTKDIQTASEAE